MLRGRGRLAECGPEQEAAAIADPFRPPARAVGVTCLHCGRGYSSAEIQWDTDDGVWRCAYPDCDGVGFGVDILSQGVDAPEVGPMTRGRFLVGGGGGV